LAFIAAVLVPEFIFDAFRAENNPVISGGIEAR